MSKLPGYKKVNVSTFKELPKGAYVCKILDVERGTVFGSKDGLRISFDIAEGEYKDYYLEQYKNSQNEDKRWSYDARYDLEIPDDDSDERTWKSWNKFWTVIEDSNNGFVFDFDKEDYKTLNNKTFGGLFYISQSESKGNIYNHTKIGWVACSQDIRDGKITKLPKDKLIETAAPVSADPSGFINVVPDAEEDLPFGTKKK